MWLSLCHVYPHFHMGNEKWSLSQCNISVSRLFSCITDQLLVHLWTTNQPELSAGGANRYVPARTVFWPQNPILGLAGCGPALSKWRWWWCWWWWCWRWWCWPRWCWQWCGTWWWGKAWYAEAAIATQELHLLGILRCPQMFLLWSFNGIPVE